MNRYFIFLAYNGTRYCGWQNQPNGLSIQQCMEEALSKISSSAITLVGAGRTDAGVHARMMVAHFDVPKPIDDRTAWTAKLNKMLPDDLAIHRIVPVTNDAHARFDALSRTYIYILTDVKNPFRYEYVCRTSLRSVSFEKMNEACSVLFDYTDFTSFSKLHSDVKTHTCRIYEAGWSKSDDCWVFTIKADRFLRNMVRAIVGTLLEVGREKLSLNNFRKVIESKDRGKAGNSVPGNALFLVDIEYPASIFTVN